jgi:hypothetical protein
MAVRGDKKYWQELVTPIFPLNTAYFNQYGEANKTYQLIVKKKV